jgi:hypothetical protein
MTHPSFQNRLFYPAILFIWVRLDIGAQILETLCLCCAILLEEIFESYYHVCIRNGGETWRFTKVRKNAACEHTPEATEAGRGVNTAARGLRLELPLAHRASKRKTLSRSAQVERVNGCRDLDGMLLPI